MVAGLLDRAERADRQAGHGHRRGRHQSGQAVAAATGGAAPSHLVQRPRRGGRMAGTGGSGRRGRRGRGVEHGEPRRVR